MNKELLQSLQELFEELKEILDEVDEQVVEETSERESKDEWLPKRSLIEIVSHEGIVLEAYKDSVGIWTWGVGVTDASGHKVGRYKDNPQSIKKVLDIYKWLLKNQYLPDVLEAFKGYTLTESQLASALSFHYNTGAIKRASWVKSFLKGDTSKAKREFMNWRSPKEIIKRREAERDLFFDNKWTNNGTATVYTQVNKPSYSPKWSSAKKINLEEEL